MFGPKRLRDYAIKRNETPNASFSASNDLIRTGTYPPLASKERRLGSRGTPPSGNKRLADLVEDLGDLVVNDLNMPVIDYNIAAPGTLFL